MTFKVLLTKDAEADLRELYDYVSKHDSPLKAGNLLDNIEKKFVRLSEFPKRGAYPKELLSLGIRDYREIFFKPYRIIYRIDADTVYIFLIVDGQREMQAILQRRLL